jgi:flavin-binding protein dodecin
MRGDLDKYPDVQPLDESQGKTWETVISEKGNTAEAWGEVLDDMGLFARIRNIRNMKEAGLESEEIVGDIDLEWVEHAQIWPFRFYQSYKAVKDAGVSDPVIEEKLSEAIDKAADSLDDNLADTFTAVDTSGSMYGMGISQNSDLQHVEIGALFGAMMMRHGSDTGAFGKRYQRVTAHYDTPTLELQQKIMDAETGGSTNAYKAIQDIRQKGESYERLVMFSDLQLWDSNAGWSHDAQTLKDEWELYKEEVNSSASLYLVDLSSYGDLNFPEGYPDVYQLQGWTSSILDYINYAEDEQALLNDIKNYEAEQVL